MPKEFTPNTYRLAGDVCFIQTARGPEIMLDAWNYELVQGFRWFAEPNRLTFYATATPTVKGVKTKIYMHRLLLGFPNAVVDHDDWNGLNNRLNNLIPGTVADNNNNRRPRFYVPNTFTALTHE
jgi:hypothetical protein